MVKYLIYIILSLFFYNFSLAQDVNIEEDIKLSFVCKLEKKILKNSDYNYQTFLAKDLDIKDLDRFEINSKQPKTLLINGLSLFLSNKKNLQYFHQNCNKMFIITAIIVPIKTLICISALW